jgi:hypothetical protein
VNNADQITVYEIDDNGNPTRVIELTGINGATFTWNGNKYDIPVDMVLSGIQYMLENSDEVK